jgi:predicted nucleotidyltransferase
MSDLSEITGTIKQHRDILQKRYGISVLGIFGSYVRGEAKEGSDIDLLAEILNL